MSKHVSFGLGLMIRISPIEIHFFSSISLSQEALSDTLLHSERSLFLFPLGTSL